MDFFRNNKLYKFYFFIILPIVAVSVLGFATTFYLLRDNAYNLIEYRLKAELAFSYSHLDSKLPGSWSVKDGMLYKGTTLINGRFAEVDQFTALTGDKATVFLGDKRVTTSIRNKNKQRLLDTKADPLVTKRVLGSGQNYYGKAKIVGEQYLTAYMPLKNANGKIIGMWFVGNSLAKADASVKNTTMMIGLISLFGFLLGIFLLIPILPSLKNELFLASYDPLTKLPNRSTFEKGLSKILNKNLKGENYALLFIDLDNFKFTNDTFGHSVGDNLLISVTNLLKDALHKEDMLARWGGDEFVALIKVTNIKEAEAVSNRLCKVINEQPIILSNSNIHAKISIGLVMLENKVDMQKLFATADIALHTAKDQGKNQVVCLSFEEGAMEDLKRLNEMVLKIELALRNNMFALFLQPIVSLGSNTINYYEALIRLHDEDGNLILPGIFIPLAENFGLISQIDRWVFQSVLNILDEHSEVKIFINISSISLNDETLLDFMESCLLENSTIAPRLGFEITETVAIKNFSLARRWIDVLKKTGCSVALDDFGVGYSSFSYLRNLNVDYVKIDGSLVRNIHKDPVDLAVFRALNTVIHTLGKKTVAEFVENEQILNVLKTIQKSDDALFSVELVQGYQLGKPAPYEEILH